MVPSLIPSFLGKPVPLYPAIASDYPWTIRGGGEGATPTTSIGSSETDPTVVGVSEPLETSLMDNDTMVKPTQRKKVSKWLTP